MPDMDGFAATTAIRRYEQTTPNRPRTPIVALTADAMEGDRDRCFAVGMDDYLAKPYTQEHLQHILTRYLAPPPRSPVSTPSQGENLGYFPPPQVPSDVDTSAWAAILAFQRPERPNILVNVLTKYLEDSRTLLMQISDAIRSRDPVALHRAAHQLKSSSAQLGALAVAAHCRELETLGRSETLGSGDILLERLVHAHHVACHRMESELRTRDATKQPSIGP